jgi:hypothetical protein
MKTGTSMNTGARGDVVASTNRFGQYQRRRPSRKKRRNKPRTPETDRAERDWRTLAALWNSLSAEQYRAWAIACEGERTRSRAGQSGRLPVRNFFFKVNNSRGSLGLSFVKDPPPRVEAGPNPVGEFRITNRGDRVVFRLEVLGPVTNFIKVYATAPQSRGTSRGRNYLVLGLLPAPRHGESDITVLYVRRFGVPEPGMRIFIRTVVEVNGKQSSPHETNCLVPPR